MDGDAMAAFQTIDGFILQRGHDLPEVRLKTVLTIYAPRQVFIEAHCSRRPWLLARRQPTVFNVPNRDTLAVTSAFLRWRHAERARSSCRPDQGSWKFVRHLRAWWVRDPPGRRLQVFGHELRQL